MYSFVYTWVKEPDPSADDNWYYEFFGFNIRYKYHPNYVSRVVHEPEDPEKGKTYTEITYPAALLIGDGSAAEARDMTLIGGMIDRDKTPDELLALDPDDYTFESVDKEMFFRLMRQALTGQPQKEGPIPEDDTQVSYWNLPTWAMMVEPDYTSGYRFQIALMNETGCIDLLYIDVQYKTGDGYADYVQLSDLVENGSATDEQRQAFELLQKLARDIEESENLLIDAEDYMDAEIAGLDFFRLYTFLKDVDGVRGINKYIETVRESVEGAVE